jgi:dinuclear metal center YbgI/SA1388 family protein
MKLAQLDEYFRSFLDIQGLQGADASLNGVQVGKLDKDIRKVVFCVDASMESFRRAKQAGADLVFVHHGIFWGKPEALTAGRYQRVSYLIQNDIALYACHLPLDAHPAYGNNAVLARLLGLQNVRPFGLYHGVSVGMRGEFADEVTLEEAIRRVLPDGSPALSVLPFGPERIKTAAVVSGGGGAEAMQAIEAGIDLYITGEPSHTVYHHAEEARMSFVAAGHYQTETWGVKALAEKVSAELGLESQFLPLPTGL